MCVCVIVVVVVVVFVCLFGMAFVDDSVEVN